MLAKCSRDFTSSPELNVIQSLFLSNVWDLGKIDGIIIIKEVTSKDRVETVLGFCFVFHGQILQIWGSTS